MANFLEYVFILLAVGGIGRIWLGPIGGIIGVLVGIFLCLLLRKRNKDKVDYGKIEDMFKKYSGRR